MKKKRAILAIAGLVIAVWASHVVTDRDSKTGPSERAQAAQEIAEESDQDVQETAEESDQSAQGNDEADPKIEETADESAKGSDNEVIRDNIFINGVEMAGMDASSAKQALSASMDRYTEAKITLKAKDLSVDATFDDLKFISDEDDIIKKAVGYGHSGNLIERFKETKRMASGQKEDFDVTFSPAAYAAERFLKAHEEELGKAAVDNSLTRKDGAFEFVNGESGFSLDVNASVKKIREFFEKGWDGSDVTIELATKEIKPRGEESDFAKIKDVLGTYSTEYGSSPSGRQTNVINGASKINGTVLFPGDEISVAAKLAPIDEENGYAEGTAYENGQVVPSIGGGVCQVSSTLYNAAILAELDITERSNHSMTVSYVDPSRDAAIAGTVKDLKFKNNLKSPIYIDLLTSNGTITASIYGEETRPANRKVEFEAEILSKTDPKSVYIADGSQPIGSRSGGGDAHTGYSAKLWKIVTVDGKEESRDVFNTSYYSVKNNEYRIGTASVSPEATAAVSAAVASQDINAINAAISQWNDAAIASRIEEAMGGGAQEGEASAEGTAIVADEPLGGAVAAQ